MRLFDSLINGREVKEDTAEELFEQGEAYQVQNPEKAFQCYFQAANMGYTKAMHKVGQCYLHKGRGVDFDIKKSAYWLEKAAENGDAKAMAMLAWHYMAGIAVSQSDEIAKKWMQNAIDIGDEKTASVVQRELDDYENKKATVTALFQTAVEMGGIPTR